MPPTKTSLRRWKEGSLRSRATDLGFGPSFLTLAGVFPIIPYVAVGLLLAIDLVALQMYAVELHAMPIHGPNSSQTLSRAPIGALVDALHGLAALAIAVDLACRWRRGRPERTRSTACSLLAMAVVALSFGGVADAREDWADRQLRSAQAPLLIQQAHEALERGQEREAVSLLEQALRDDFNQLPERLRLGWLLLSSEDPSVRDVDRALWHHEVFEAASIYHDGDPQPTELDGCRDRALMAVRGDRAGHRKDALGWGHMAIPDDPQLHPEFTRAVQEVLRRELFQGDPAPWSELLERLSTWPEKG